MRILQLNGASQVKPNVCTTAGYQKNIMNLKRHSKIYIGQNFS